MAVKIDGWPVGVNCVIVTPAVECRPLWQRRRRRTREEKEERGRWGRVWHGLSLSSDAGYDVIAQRSLCVSRVAIGRSVGAGQRAAGWLLPAGTNEPTSHTDTHLTAPTGSPPRRLICIKLHCPFFYCIFKMGLSKKRTGGRGLFIINIIFSLHVADYC